MTELYEGLPPEKDAALQAFIMTRGIFKNNLLLDQGIEPVNQDGDPLYVEYVSDVPTYVKICFGNTNEVNDAIIAAYESNHANH